MTIHNHPEALTQLRADHVEVEYSPLEKIAIELFGVKVNPFKTHMQSRGHTHPKEDWKRSDIYDSGGSPSDVFYDDGEIFINASEMKVLLHELCHFIVADDSNFLDLPNWGLDDGLSHHDEVLACMLDFFFGYMSGQYNYSSTCLMIDDYSFGDEAQFPTFVKNIEDVYHISAKILSNWLFECAKEANKFRLGRKLAKKLNIKFTQKTIKEKCEKDFAFLWTT